MMGVDDDDGIIVIQCCRDDDIIVIEGCYWWYFIIVIIIDIIDTMMTVCVLHCVFNSNDIIAAQYDNQPMTNAMCVIMKLQCEKQCVFFNIVYYYWLNTTSIQQYW
jgi:hypothetical protein